MYLPSRKTTNVFCWIGLQLIKLTAWTCKVKLLQPKGVAMLWEYMLGATGNTFKPVLPKTLSHKIQFILNSFC